MSTHSVRDLSTAGPTASTGSSAPSPTRWHSYLALATIVGTQLMLLLDATVG